MNIIQNLPRSEESERLVLGWAITSADGFKIVCTGLQKEDFYFWQHQIIFSVLKKMKGPTDIYLLCEEFRKQDLLSEIGGVAYITNIVRSVGTSAYFEEYVEQVRHFAVLRGIARQGQIMLDRALGEKENPENLLEDLRRDLKSLELKYVKNISVLSLKERLQKEATFLDEHKGKKYLGIKTSLIEEFNESFLGIRGLNILAAAPNVGKTALSIQLGLDAVMTEEEVCLVYVSLEMSAEEIFRRMILLLAEIDYRTFVFGQWTKEQEKRILNAKQVLASLDERVQILDSISVPAADAISISDYVASVKSKTSCKRAVLIVDYLQVWPASSSVRNLSENELDKWRIGEMKKLKDVLHPDPVIVISEARKPNIKDSCWGGDLSDVMGAARTTYTPDVVMLITPLKPKHLQMLWEESRMPSLQTIEIKENESEKEGLRVKCFLEKNGIALCKLEVPKARDGMRKFSILLEFHFQKNKFQKLDLEYIRNSFVFPGIVNKKRSFVDLFSEE
jgi:replicative DNA helicase